MNMRKEWSRGRVSMVAACVGRWFVENNQYFLLGIFVLCLNICRSFNQKWKIFREQESDQSLNDKHT